MKKKKGTRGSTGEAASGRGQKAQKVRHAQSWQIDYERLRVVAKIELVWPDKSITASSWARAWRSSNYLVPSSTRRTWTNFRREVTLLHKLKHPHVLTFYGISRRDVYCFIVTSTAPMPWMRSCRVVGSPMMSTRCQWQAETDAATHSSGRTTILYQVALALQYLHAERVLHHDLKPGNILLDRDFTAKVSDFGLAQLVADTEDVVSKGPTKAPRRMSAGATAVYAAPEMLLKLRGKVQGSTRTGRKFFGFYSRACPIRAE